MNIILRIMCHHITIQGNIKPSAYSYTIQRETIAFFKVVQILSTNHFHQMTNSLWSFPHRRLLKIAIFFILLLPIKWILKWCFTGLRLSISVTHWVHMQFLNEFYIWNAVCAILDNDSRSCQWPNYFLQLCFKKQTSNTPPTPHPPWIRLTYSLEMQSKWN